MSESTILLARDVRLANGLSGNVVKSYVYYDTKEDFNYAYVSDSYDSYKVWVVPSKHEGIYLEAA